MTTLGLNGCFLTADLPLCSGSFFLGPRSPLWLFSHPTEKAPAGRGLVGNNPDARRLETALSECKHPSSLKDQSSCQDFEKPVTQAPLGWLVMPHHRCCYVGRWGKGDLKDSVRDSTQTCKCQTHWARSSGKHKPLGTTVRHHLGKVSVI